MLLLLLLCLLMGKRIIIKIDFFIHWLLFYHTIFFLILICTVIIYWVLLLLLNGLESFFFYLSVHLLLEFESSFELPHKTVRVRVRRSSWLLKRRWRVSLFLYWLLLLFRFVFGVVSFLWCHFGWLVFSPIFLFFICVCVCLFSINS